MPGFLPKTADERFTTKSKVVYRVESDVADVSVRQNELDSCEEIRFYLTADGVKMSADETKNYPLSIRWQPLSYIPPSLKDSEYLYWKH